MEYQQHPLSAAFPAMPAEDFQLLVDSIVEHGVLNPITLHEGMVIDGWHRYTASKLAYQECPTVELDSGIDPRDFVLAQNKARRHITQAQLIASASAVYQWRPSGRPSNNSALSADFVSSKELAEKTGSGVRSVEQYRQVEREAAPEVVQAVKRGDIGLPKAAAIAKLPKEEQAAAIAKPLPKAKPTAVEAVEDTEPDASDELAEAAQSIRELVDENQQLTDRLAVAQMDATEEEKSEAAHIITDLRAHIRQIEIQLDAIKASRDVYLAENAELKKQVQRLQNQIKRMGA